LGGISLGLSAVGTSTPLRRQTMIQTGAVGSLTKGEKEGNFTGGLACSTCAESILSVGDGGSVNPGGGKKGCGGLGPLGLPKWGIGDVASVPPVLGRVSHVTRSFGGRCDFLM